MKCWYIITQVFVVSRDISQWLLSMHFHIQYNTCSICYWKFCQGCCFFNFSNCKHQHDLQFQQCQTKTLLFETQNLTSTLVFCWFFSVLEYTIRSVVFDFYNESKQIINFLLVSPFVSYKKHYQIQETRQAGFYLRIQNWFSATVQVVKFCLKII